ncbi:ABC transporter substrate-binding protein [Vogesella sp. LIG4]|uniref:substrate-binding periplasmic protein n=1 Tax=Vogesella sp. LIG4 TaxID=1192162 RepID=UPI00081F9645|nr:transporter substrate-binding domain-containing protein [Vogesella sp. LIG4]SCK09450.1 polar amino acid transport system substrate-binding protein [Vogesella sp. LIG4]
MRLFAAGLLLALATASQGAQLTIYTTDYPPLSMLAADGRISGIGIDMLRQAGRNSGISLDIRADLSWKRAQQITQQTRNACIYPLTRAAEREQRYRWASLLNPGELGLFALADGPRPATLAAASKLRTVVMLGTTAEDRLKEHNFSYSTTQAPADSLRMLLHRAVDLWAVHDLVASYYAAQQGIAIKHVLKLTSADSWLGCNPAVPDTLTASLDKAIAQLRSNGESERINRNYLRRPPPP